MNVFRRRQEMCFVRFVHIHSSAHTHAHRTLSTLKHEYVAMLKKHTQLALLYFECVGLLSEGCIGALGTIHASSFMGVVYMWKSKRLACCISQPLPPLPTNTLRSYYFLSFLPLSRSLSHSLLLCLSSCEQFETFGNVLKRIFYRFNSTFYSFVQVWVT